MLGRLEYKYLAPTAMLDRIRADLLPFVDRDPVDGMQNQGIYTVRSIYYDTPRFHCYGDKLAGLRVRRKYRIRGYNARDERSVVFLEIKKKYADFIDKHRAAVPARDLASLLETRDIDRYVLANGGGGQARGDAERFLYNYYRRRLTPAALVVYDREAYFGRYDPSLRITCDLRLRTNLRPGLDSLYDEAGLVAAMTSGFIFEVKFHRNALPAWVRSLISRYRLHRMSLSKYTICMDSQPAAHIASAHTGTPFTRALEAASVHGRHRC